ncbi:hypothetical protein V8F33_011080 [Rhypophila sp. PSN 637]
MRKSSCRPIFASCGAPAGRNCHRRQTALSQGRKGRSQKTFLEDTDTKANTPGRGSMQSKIHTPAFFPPIDTKPRRNATASNVQMGKRKRTTDERSKPLPTLQRQAPGPETTARNLNHIQHLHAPEYVNQTEQDQPGSNITKSATSTTTIANDPTNGSPSFNTDLTAQPSMVDRDASTASSDALTALLAAALNISRAPELNFVSCLRTKLLIKSTLKKIRKHVSKASPRLSRNDKVPSTQKDETPIITCQHALPCGPTAFSCSPGDVEFKFKPDPEGAPPTWPVCELKRDISHFPLENSEPDTPEPKPDEWGWDFDPPNFPAKQVDDWAQSFPVRLTDPVSEPQQEIPPTSPSRGRPRHGEEKWTLANILNEGGDRPERSPSLVSESRVKLRQFQPPDYDLVSRESKPTLAAVVRPPSPPAQRPTSWTRSPRWSHVHLVAGLRYPKVFADQVDIMEERKDFIRMNKSQAVLDKEKRDEAKRMAKEVRRMIRRRRKEMEAIIADVRRLFGVDGEEDDGQDGQERDKNKDESPDEWDAPTSPARRMLPEDPSNPEAYLSKNRYRKARRRERRRNKKRTSEEEGNDNGNGAIGWLNQEVYEESRATTEEWAKRPQEDWMASLPRSFMLLTEEARERNDEWVF